MRRPYRSTSIVEFESRFPDEQASLNHIAQVRFGAPPRCPRCPEAPLLHGYKLPRHLFCYKCGSVIGILSRTALANSVMPARTWFYLFLLIANRTTGFSSSFVARHLGLSSMAAIHALSAAKAHIIALSERRQFGANGSVVQIDETWIPLPPSSGDCPANGVIVFGIYDSQGVQTCIVPDRRRETLLPIIKAWVRPGATIVSDQHKAYEALGSHGYSHVRLNHSRGEWVNANGYSMLGIEGYWGNFKYYMRSQNRHPTEHLLPGYLAEHGFRYNMRKQGRCPFNALIERFPEIDSGSFSPAP